MPQITLGGTLPSAIEHNGLVDWADRLLSERADITLIAVVAIDVQKVVEVVHSGEAYPVLRLAWVEPVGRVGDVPDELRDLVVSLRAQRTGSAPLPFEQPEQPDSEPVYATGPDDDPARAAKLAPPKSRTRRKPAAETTSEEREAAQRLSQVVFEG